MSRAHIIELAGCATSMLLMNFKVVWNGCCECEKKSCLYTFWQFSTFNIFNVFESSNNINSCYQARMEGGHRGLMTPPPNAPQSLHINFTYLANTLRLLRRNSSSYPRVVVVGVVLPVVVVVVVPKILLHGRGRRSEYGLYLSPSARRK